MTEEPSNGELGRQITGLGTEIGRFRAEMTKDLDAIMLRFNDLVPRREHDLEIRELRERLDKSEEIRRWLIAAVIIPILAVGVAIWATLRSGG